MAKNLKINDRVYVPSSRLEGVVESPVALHKTKVVEVGDRKVKVQLPGGAPSNWLGASIVHKDVGLIILNFGDFETELTLLDPLAKSVLQFCRLLLPDDQVLGVKVRGLSELKKVWGLEQAAHSHVILIGHGTKETIRLGADGDVDIGDFCEALRVHAAPPKTFVSLCCNTGYKSFAGVVSRKAICSSFVAPIKKVHGAAASQFCQAFLAYHFLEGSTAGTSFNRARISVPGGNRYRLWQGGKVKMGAKRK